jgi:hypothetical protein
VNATPLDDPTLRMRPKPLPSAATRNTSDTGNETGSGVVGGSSNDQSFTSPLRAPVARKLSQFSRNYTLLLRVGTA